MPAGNERNGLDELIAALVDRDAGFCTSGATDRLRSESERLMWQKRKHARDVGPSVHSPPPSLNPLLTRTPVPAPSNSPARIPAFPS